MNRWLTALLPAAAMSLGWGIRGQFGHETGAMVPGALVGFALAVLSKADTITALYLGAAGALGTSIGGVETYGQTVGLVHDVPHSPHYWWGMLGLAVKGAAWIGFAGAFLGMARDARRYRPLEIAGLMLALLALWWLGVRVLNSPHEPPDRLPLIYFSKWFDPKPRPEVWGGLWFALIGLLLYLRFIRRDRFAVGMGVCGILSGGVGFPGGESLQAGSIHSHPFGEYLNQWMDWWKVMEMSFGAIAGLGLGLGWQWLQRVPQKDTTNTPPPTPPTRGGELRADSPPLVGGAGGGVFEILLFIFYWLWTGLMLAEWFEVVGEWWEVPFLSLGIGMTCFFSGRTTPFLVSVPFLTFVSAANVARYHSSEQGVLNGTLGTAAVLVLTAASGFIGWRWWKRNALASVFLMFTAWVQVFISACKGNPKVLMEQGLLAYFSGSFWVCELGYVVLCLFMMWAAAWRSGAALSSKPDSGDQVIV